MTRARIASGVLTCVVLAAASSVVVAQEDDDFDFLFGDDASQQSQQETPGDERAGDDAESAAPSSANEDASSEDGGATDPPADSESVETIPVAATRARTRAQRSGRVLEEIVVTAQKRQQSLSDVPISVSAVSGDKLRDAGIENLSDLSEYAPNFKLVEGGLVPLIYMRGVGSGSNQGFELSVGMYNDGIHLGRPHQTLAAFMDLERVEVLKGPQSILFGKNAIAGAINITSAKPTEDFESSISASWFAPNRDQELSGFVSGPLLGGLRGRFAARLRQEDGYVHNISQQRTDPGVDELASRGTLSWDASDRLAFDLKLEYNDRQAAGRTFQVIDRGVLNESEETPFGLNDFRDTNEREFQNVESGFITLNSSLALGGGDLEFVTGYNGYNQAELFDADSSRIDTVFLDSDERYRQFSQEVRWVSPPGETLDFIVGGFYQRSDQVFGEFGTLNVRTGTGFLAFLPPETADTIAMLGEANLVTAVSADLVRLFTTDVQSYSVFGQLTWNFLPRWRMTAGARYVSERKQGSRDFDTFEPGTQNDVDPVTAQVLDALLVEAHSLAGERRSDLLLPSLNVQYDLGADTMVYASATRGAKSGGYDARNNNDNEGPNGGATNFEYEDEIADAFELGTKARLFGGIADLNAALFYVDYSDTQVSVFDGVAGFTVTNAGASRVQGAELDGRWAVSEAFTLSGSLAYLDFTWTSYVDGPCYFGGPEPSDAGTCDLTGQENQQTPDWSASLSGNYQRSIWRGLVFSAAADANFRDTHFTSGDLDPRGEQDAYVKFNTRLSLGPASGLWNVALVGKNLTDELTTGIGAPVPLDTGG